MAGTSLRGSRDRALTLSCATVVASPVEIAGRALRLKANPPPHGGRGLGRSDHARIIRADQASSVSIRVEAAIDAEQGREDALVREAVEAGRAPPDHRIGAGIRQIQGVAAEPGPDVGVERL